MEKSIGIWFMNELQIYSLYHVLQAGGNRYTKKRNQQPCGQNIVQQGRFSLEKWEKKMERLKDN